jgi:hypothetical protein
MSKSKQTSQDNMRRDICAPIRRNLFWLGGSLSRHEVVEVLASVLSCQLDIIRDDARKQRIE